MFTLMLIIHIIFGTVCLITGAVAASSRKRKGGHTKFGEVYHWSYVIVFVTSLVLAILDWASSAYLFYIALFSYGLALLGYLARKIRWKNWKVSHIHGMLGSYIGIITAVMVTNFTKIPLLNEVPVLVYWFLPTIIGAPLIFRVDYKYRGSQ